MAFQPLKIVFRMITPICLGHPWINFDSLIAHLKLRRDYPDYRALPSCNPIYDIGKIDLPLKRFKFGCDFVYHASVSIFDVSDYYSATIYKRFTEKYLRYEKMRVKQIQRGSGFFRDFMINHIYIPAKTVTFYVCGDKEELEELLKGLPGLGKKTAIGYGFIKEFSIDEADEDYSLVKDGKAMRPIPIKACKEAEDIALLAYKIPYWAKRNVAPCVPPGAKVALEG
ncbi:hypothetical protein ACO3UB_08325 (plasmid) [Methanocaldococcus sp. 16A]